jgi:hypothetical protein
MEDVSKAIKTLAAAIISVTIAASVAYETGYFSIVGYKYQGVLSTADYLSSALEWLPWLFLLYGLGFVLAHAGSPILLERAAGFKKRRPRAFLIATLLLTFSVIGGVIVVPFYEVLLNAPVAALPLVAIPLFLRLSRSISPLQKMTAIVVSSVAVLVALYCSGIGHAHREFEVIENAYVMQLNEGRAGIQILRTLEKGLLVWDPANSKADFVRWEKVDRLTHLIWKSHDAPWLESLGCHFWRRLCYREPPPSP